jgi:hypothetical protein
MLLAAPALMLTWPAGELLGYFASGAAAEVTETVPRLLGRPAISFEQFVKDHRGAFL